MRALARTRAALARAILLCLILAVTVPTQASDTISHAYYAFGRLVKVAHSGTVSNGAGECYNYDKGDNRANVTVYTNSDCNITLTLSPTTLPNGTVGTAYSQTVTASGGTSPYIFSTTSGTLPTGLALSSGGALSGTSTTAATSNFTITAADSASHAGSQAYSMTVASGTGACSGVSFSIANVQIPEGSTLVFTVTKTGPTSSTCTVNYATQDGTAIAGNDYTATSGTLSFISTQTSATVSVTTFDNGVYDSPNLQMYLNLSSPSSGATLTNTQGIGTLKEVDKNPCPLC